MASFRVRVGFHILKIERRLDMARVPRRQRGDVVHENMEHAGSHNKDPGIRLSDCTEIRECGGPRPGDHLDGLRIGVRVLAVEHPVHGREALEHFWRRPHGQRDGPRRGRQGLSLPMTWTYMPPLTPVLPEDR